ncbi:PilZ domain-containing protein [Methylobacterium sp. M6A4_1b]
MTTNLEQSEAPTAVERREERNPTNWIATIRFRDGTEIPCSVKDVSKSGARICVGANQSLPPVFMLRIIGRDFLCLVRIAWRRGDFVGVRIERVGKVPPPAATPAPTVTAPPTAPAIDPPADISTIGELDGGGIGVRSRKRGISSF